MTTRLIRSFAVIGLLVAILGTWPVAAQAQDGERYDNPALGVAFDLPGGWQVVTGPNMLIAGTPGDVTRIQEGDVPEGLAVRMVFGTFNELGITDATQLPDLLNRLVESSITPPPPERVAWSNASGYQTIVTMAQEGITTRVALLAVPGGRVAIVRGIASIDAWNSGASAQFDALAATVIFSLPQRDENILDTITANDGGVLWHYLAPPESGRVVRAGGIVYDMFNIMYMVAGPGGVLALEMNSGNPISFMGPWYGGDFVDVAIGPDTKLYMANSAADTQQAVMVVDRAGNWTRAWGTRGDGAGQFAPAMPQTIAVTTGGDVWTVSEGHSNGIRDRLYRFDAFGNLLQTVDLAAINPDLAGVRLAANPRTGAIVMTGATGGLNVIDANGQPLVVNLAQEILQDLTPVDIAIAPNDNIIVALSAPGLGGFGFLELSAAGKLLDAFGFPYDESRGGLFLPGEYSHPGGLVIGPDGTGYWTETHPATGYTQIQRFTFTGDGVLPLGAEMAGGTGDDVSLGLGADPAHGGGTIVYGQSVRGALNNRYPSHNWTFEGHAGDHIVITMIDASGANLIDPKLALKTPDGRELAANDDVGAVHPEGMSERDALIDFFLPGDGVFVIEAGRFGGRGDYVLTLELLAE